MSKVDMRDMTPDQFTTYVRNLKTREMCQEVHKAWDTIMQLPLQILITAVEDDMRDVDVKDPAWYAKHRAGAEYTLQAMKELRDVQVRMRPLHDAYVEESERNRPRSLFDVLAGSVGCDHDDDEECEAHKEQVN